MTRVPNASMRTEMPGIWQFGLMFYVEGTLMIKGNDDIMSEPDEQGRRWVEFDDTVYLDWWDFMNDDSKLTKLLDELEGDYDFAENRGELLRKYVERYVQLAEQFAQSHKKEIIDTFNRKGRGDWDELLLNDIKLIDVIWGKYDETGSLVEDENEIKKIEKKLKSIVSGKVIITDDDSDVKKFVMSRKPKI
jgi:hypothetical protein